MTIHDYAEFETKVRAEGIPRPTLHWVKDGKQIKADEEGFKMVFGEPSEVQVSSDLSIAHFAATNAGSVRFIQRI